MSDYLSGRELELNIGISSYTESKTVLNVIGKSVLGVTSTTDLTTDTLKVKGDFSFTNFTTSGLVISGVITSGRFISTIATGNSPISVASSTLVQNLNAEYLNGYPGNYYTNASNLSSGFIPASRLNTANNFNVLGDLYVSNNLSVGGTSVVLNAKSLQIKDKDITLGITTDAFGNDISTDLTANHGGIAIASTVGIPLFSFSIAGINSLPDTYKQLMWIKSGTFAGLNTDAFLFNYGVGIGTNQIQSGVRLAVGPLNVTDSEVKSSSFVGTLYGNASTATTSNNISGGQRGSIPYQDSPGITTVLAAGSTNFILLSGGPGAAPYWGPASSASQAFTGITVRDEGTVVGIQSSINILDIVGPNVIATASSGIATITVANYVSRSGYSTNSGISTYSALSGIATNVIGGISSVTSLTVSGVGTTIPVKIGTGSSIIVIDSLGELGIGTENPQFPLDVRGNARFTGNLYANNVISSDANLSEIVRSNVGIVSTNSLNTIVLDTYNAAAYRSAKYTIQVSSQGSLILGSSSISSITGGSNYFPGTYSNQDVISQSGLGSYGKATLTVVPEYSLVVKSCIDGVFTASSNLPTGIITNTTIFFNQNLNLSQRQQSQISSFALTTSGVGYTEVPTLTVSSPIIESNPVPEVGIGSTAILIVNSMRVSNAVQTSSGYVTTTIPTITFSGPSTGVTATGQVSFGISTLSITRPGSGYTSSPSFAITSPYSPTGFAATVGLGISSLNLIVSGGIGYLNLETPTITINPIGGIGTGGVISGVGVAGTIAFTLVNSGFGYTVPPLVSVSGGTGIGAGVTISTMFVSNINVTNSGDGVTVGLARTTDITFFGGGGTGAGATVSTIVSTGVSITNSGYGYTSTTIPTITYSPVGATTAQVGLAISSIQQLSTGIGYTVIPSVTVTPGPSVGTTVNAGLSTILGYAGFADTSLLPGPIYGGATVYYIIPISSNTFAISNTIGIGLTPNATRVGYGFSVGLSTAKTGTLAIGSTTIIAGGINTTGITVGTRVQNSTLITPGTIVSAIGSGTITLNAPALNTGSISTSFNFGNFISAGGKVNAISFTDIGSGYVASQSITTRLSNFDRISPVYDSNVGTGFTFTVSNIVNNFQISDILTLHSVGSATTNAFAIEEGGISDVSELGEFSASLAGTGSTIFNLNFTPIYAYNTLKFNKTLFTI